GRCQPARPGKAEPLFVVIRSHAMLCCQMRMKALETPPADQTFNRVTAEVARNVAARLKSRWRLRSHQRQGIILASNEQLFCEVGLRGRSELVLCRQKVLNEKAITRDPICGPELAQCRMQLPRDRRTRRLAA